jgi:acyl-CoA thioesterase FadM
MSLLASTGIVAWSDTDASGRFHFTAPWRWVENTEHAFYRSALPGIEIGRFPRRSASASYELPLQAGDTYAVELDVGHIGCSSITYRWRVLGPRGVSVTGGHTVVHIDEDGRPSPVPQALHAAVIDRKEIAQ